MKKDMPVEDNYFDDFDFENAETIKHPLIQDLQDKAAYACDLNVRDLPLDDDIVEWLFSQDDKTKRHINEVIRHFMAIKVV